MFSRRLNWDAQPNAIAERIALRGQPLIDLTESNPTRAGLTYPSADILAALSDPRSIHYEPTARGALETREAVAAYHNVHPSRVLLTTSTSESYSWLFKLLCDPGDEILVPRPSYPLFEYLASLESVKVKQYPLVYHEGWWLDIESLRELITERTRAILFVNPNNPTGSFLKRDEFNRVAEICASLSIAIISDEVFADYAYGDDPRRQATLTTEDRALTFTLSGLSKVSALPQMKLGWIIAGGHQHQQALHRLELIADTYLSVSTPVQLGGAALLNVRNDLQRQIRERLARNLSYLTSTIPPSYVILKAEGGWYSILRVPRVRTELQWVLDLLDRRVQVQPGFFYDFETEAYLILSLLTPETFFADGVRRIASMPL